MRSFANFGLYGMKSNDGCLGAKVIVVLLSVTLDGTWQLKNLL